MRLGGCSGLEDYSPLRRITAIDLAGGTFPAGTSLVGSNPAIGTAMLTVAPPAGNYVTSVTVAPAFVVGGRTASATVTLAAPSADKGGTDVALTSSDPAVLAVPATVRVKPSLAN